MPQPAAAPELECWEGGSLVRVSCGTSTVGARVAGGARGKVGSFGRASKLRLMRTLGKIKHAVLPHFLTLTYPDEFPITWEVWKAHRVAWEKRLYRQFPGACMVWKLELKRRLSGRNAGSIAPHYHAFLWGVPMHPEVQAWISRTWYEVVGSGDERHLEAGTRYEVIRTWRGVMSYASKYLGKESCDDSGGEWHVGRWWGVTGRARIPWAARIVMAIGLGDAHACIRLLRRYARFKGRAARRAYQSLTVMTGDAGAWGLQLTEWLYEVRNGQA